MVRTSIIQIIRVFHLPNVGGNLFKLKGPELSCLQLFCKVHSQKQLAHWAVNVTVDLYAWLFSGSLMCNF